MSTFSLKSDGNIDVTRLEKDLRSALDFDTKYKQADNMKKRACKIATDYDEFKAFVACAHLKTVRYPSDCLLYCLVQCKLPFTDRARMRHLMLCAFIFVFHIATVVPKFRVLVQPKKGGRNQLLVTSHLVP